MPISVIILGGGVAGMSAAHELVQRGYTVTVFEKQKQLPGGKARSEPVPDSASDGRQPLPGEHGFRFFPGFYKHIIDTMQRIPFVDPSGTKTVADNLVECGNIMLARVGKIPIETPSHFPRNLQEVQQIIHNLFHSDTGLQPGEANFIAEKLWQLMTSCEKRRFNEYERTGWWTFTEAAVHSANYRALFVEGLTRSLVAAKAETCNTKTNGDILLQMIFNFSNPKIQNDRILCGPTNDKWLFPWLDYLRAKGVTYHFDSLVTKLEAAGTQLSGVWIQQNGASPARFQADYYLCALPVERTAPLVANPALLALDSNLQNIITLSHSVAWMNGIQFYLGQDVPIINGHIILAYSPWAITAISQAQFWKDIDFSKYGHGDVHGILSIDLSDWDTPGVIFNKPAKDCTKKQVTAEVWEQLKQSLNVRGNILLKDDNLKLAYIDNDIIFADDLLNFHEKSRNPGMNELAGYGSHRVITDEEPLLVNQVNTWAIRSDDYTAIPNLFLAADYVRTFTDLATMEGANEAARRAVNAILDRSGSKQPLCKVWNLQEPKWLLYYKWLDEQRYNKGLPWKLTRPWFATVLNWFFSLFNKLKLYQG
jgi:uncharacterized protein with NAD-binding domain and iron-sulfur cluster